MSGNLEIDIVSDVSCPWCIIGYQSLERALAQLEGKIQATINWHPFELNPQMPKEGQDITEHLTQKYGISESHAARNREVIKQRGLAVGYEFGDTAATILNSDQYVDEVRREQQHFLGLGIQSVPAFILNRRHLLSGGQPVEVFVKALSQIAAEDIPLE